MKRYERLNTFSPVTGLDDTGDLNGSKEKGKFDITISLDDMEDQITEFLWWPMNGRRE